MHPVHCQILALLYRSELFNNLSFSQFHKMGGLRPKGHAGTADHPGGCPGQNIREVKNSGR